MRIGRSLASASTVLLFGCPTLAADLQPQLAAVSFLIGSWSGNDGKVADTGGTSKGRSEITPETNGALLLRRDHVDLVDRNGKTAGSFDILMTIYPEGGTLHADYFDGQHVIHYVSASVMPGKSVVFRSAPVGPVFQLVYELQGTDLAISFGVTPPGQSTAHLISSGKLHKAE